MQSTINLFDHLYNRLPPMFPKEIKERMGHALNHLKRDQTVTLEDIEKTMVLFGYEIWPWNQAYREFLALAETDIGEHFLLPKLSPDLQNKYHDFKKYGGTLRELHSGSPAEFFSIDERNELCAGLVDMQVELREYVSRDVISMNTDRYLERVGEFKRLIKEIRETLDHLRDLADKEQDHPSLAHEIRDKVRYFEHGLCLLAPELEYHAVCEAPTHFQGRKRDLNRMKGINVPVQINFS